MNQNTPRVFVGDIEKITEDLAVKRLVEHIRESADADDLARLYTLICTDNPTVIVLDTGTESDPYKDGERAIAVDANGNP